MELEDIQNFIKNGNYRRVKNHRNRLKEKLVEYKGGKCEICGYDKCVAALEFHHSDPSIKDFSIAQYKSLSFENLKKEVDKCMLLCANCHRELHHKENIKKQNEIELNEIAIYKEILENRDKYGPIPIKESYKHLANTTIIDDINNGVSRKDILEKYHINNRTFNLFLKEQGLSYSQRKIVENKPTKEELIELLQKLSKSAIGRMYGVTCGSVIKWCKKYNLQ